MIAMPIRTQDATWLSIVDIFQPDEKAQGDVERNAGDDGEALVDPEDENLRTERLRDIKLGLDQLWWSNSAYVAAAAERLTDLSRDREPHESFNSFNTRRNNGRASAPSQITDSWS